MWPPDPLEVFVPDPAHLALLRRVVAEAASEWSVADVDTLVLVVQELASNGLDHGRGPVGVEAHPIADGRVAVEVRDTGAGRPRTGPVADDAERGRGLRLVDALAERWGVRPLPQGKAVWAVLDATRPPDRLPLALVA